MFGREAVLSPCCDFSQFFFWYSREIWYFSGASIFLYVRYLHTWFPVVLKAVKQAESFPQNHTLPKSQTSNMQLGHFWGGMKKQPVTWLCTGCSEPSAPLSSWVFVKGRNTSWICSLWTASTNARIGSLSATRSPDCTTTEEDLLVGW